MTPTTIPVFMLLLLIMPHMGYCGTNMADDFFKTMMKGEAVCLGVCIFEDIDAVQQKVMTVCYTEIMALIHQVTTALSSLGLSGQQTTLPGMPSANDLQSLVCGLFGNVDLVERCSRDVIKPHCGKDAVDWFAKVYDDMTAKIKGYLRCDDSTAPSMLHCMLNPTIMASLTDITNPGSCIFPLVASIGAADFQQVYDRHLKISQTDPQSMCMKIKEMITCMKGKMATVSQCSGFGDLLETEMNGMLNYAGCATFTPERDAVRCLANPTLIHKFDLSLTAHPVMMPNNQDLNYCAVSRFVNEMHATIGTDCGKDKWTYQAIDEVKYELVDFFDYKGECPNTEKVGRELVIGKCKCKLADYTIGTDKEVACAAPPGPAAVGFLQAVVVAVLYLLQ